MGGTAAAPTLLPRNYARAAGGAWLGAGPEGVRQTDGARDPSGRRDDAEARPTDCAAIAPGCARDPLAVFRGCRSDKLKPRRGLVKRQPRSRPASSQRPAPPNLPADPPPKLYKLQTSAAVPGENLPKAPPSGCYSSRMNLRGLSATPFTR